MRGSLYLGFLGNGSLSLGSLCLGSFSISSLSISSLSLDSLSLDTVVARDQKNEQVYEDTEESVAPQKCGKDAEKVDVEQVILGVEVQ